MGQKCSINFTLVWPSDRNKPHWFFIQLLKNTKHQIYLDQRQSTMGDHVVSLMLMCLTSGFHGNPEWQKEWEVPDPLDNSVLGCDLAAGNGGCGHTAGHLTHSHVTCSAANRLIGEVVQSRRRPLLGPTFDFCVADPISRWETVGSTLV